MSLLRVHADAGVAGHPSEPMRASRGGMQLLWRQIPPLVDGRPRVNMREESTKYRTVQQGKDETK